MHRIPIARMARGLSACLVVLAVALVAATAHADARTEKEAQALQKKAVQEDFLNVDYPAAIKKLRTAAAKCGTNKCSASLRGALLRDLGAMLILGGSVDEGKANFTQAIGLDASLELDPSYKSPQLDAVWNAAKKGGGGGGAEPATGSGGGAGGGAAGGGAGAGGGGGASAGGSQPSGDFTHSPVAEQAVHTPVPIYAEYPGSETLKKVVAKYKATGMSDWKPVELQKMGDGWGGLVPCKDVTTPGKVQYYLQGFNPGNDPVATAGSRNKPYSVTIKTAIEGPEPSLPGKDPPKQCSEMAGAECPPDFPGCNNPKKGAGEDCDKNKDCQSDSCVGGKCEDKKAGGEECAKDDECASKSCSDGKCTAPKKGAGEECEASDECDSASCKEGKCEGGGGGGGESGGFYRVWGGVGASLDLLLMPSAKDVCALNAAGTGPLTGGNPYTCYDPTYKTNFPGSSAAAAGINTAIQTAAMNPNADDFVSGGFTHGPLTLFASLDYALSPNIMIGGRVGYEALTYPGTDPAPAFPPLRIEARFTYMIGQNAINKVAPVLFGGVGLGEFDAMVPTTVVFGTPPPGFSQTAQEDAWLTAGPFYGTAGGGVRIPFGGGEKKKFAFTVLAKVQGAFGGTAGFLIGFAPELGLQMGF